MLLCRYCRERRGSLTNTAEWMKTMDPAISPGVTEEMRDITIISSTAQYTIPELRLAMELCTVHPQFAGRTEV